MDLNRAVDIIKYMTSLAAIDVGSNAIRMIVAETNGKGGFSVLETSRESIRLGKDVFSEGHVFDETIERAQEAFRRFRKIMNILS